MRGGGESESQRQQHDAGTPLVVWALHGVSHADGKIDSRKEPKCHQNLIVGIRTGMNDWRSKTIERKRNVSSSVAIEPSRHPPEVCSERESGGNKRQPDEQQDVADFVAHFPGSGGRGLSAENALQGQRQSCSAVGERSVMNIAAGGEVAGQRRRLLPHLASAAGKFVIGLA